MVNENNVHLVKSIGSINFPCGGEINRMPPTSKMFRTCICKILLLLVLLLLPQILLTLKYNACS
jgi:hypothetical protein